MDTISRTGVVDKVQAKRRKGEVVYLEALIRFETGLVSSYDYTQDIRIDEISVAFGPLAGINPGDLVQMDLVIQSPLTQRFAPALEASVTDVDDDDDDDDDDE